MSAESVLTAPSLGAVRVRGAMFGYRLHSSLIITALVAVGVPDHSHAAAALDPEALAQARANRLVQDTHWVVESKTAVVPATSIMPDESITSVPLASLTMPVPNQASAADRLRNDPVATAPVPPEPKSKPQAAVKLTSNERAVARHIARIFRIDGDAIEGFVHQAYKAARELRLEPHLILAVMAVESGFDANARSAAGAQGLMQVHTRVHGSRFEPFGGANAVFDPPANIKVGARILSEYVNRYGDVAAGLKAYVGAALLPSDGGYGTKVLNRQAEFDAVVKPEVPPAVPPAVTAKVEDADRAVATQASDTARSSEGSSF